MVNEPLLDCIEIEPDEPVVATMIWLHGYGANGEDLAPMALDLKVPGVRYIFPTAPNTVTAVVDGETYMGSVWYTIRSLMDHDEAQIKAATQRIGTLIEREAQRGIPPERVFVGGFSQGAAMALYMGDQYPAKLAGILALSGYPIPGLSTQDNPHAANATTPVLICHGENDTSNASFDIGKLAHLMYACSHPAADVRFSSFPIGHAVSDDEIEVIRSWLRELLKTKPFPGW